MQQPPQEPGQQSLYPPYNPYQGQSSIPSPYAAQPGYYAPVGVPRARSRTAFRYGLLCGGILTLLVVLINLWSFTPSATAYFQSLLLPLQSSSFYSIAYGLVFSALQGVLALIIYFLVGFTAAKRSQQSGIGLAVGLWASLWYLLADLLLLIPFTIIGSLVAGLTFSAIMLSFTDPMYIAALVISIMADTAIALTLGLVACTLGARVGGGATPSTTT